MKIIIGLGNPGDKYKNTRHNAGFMAVDFVVGDWKLPAHRSPPEADEGGDIGSWQNNFESMILRSSHSHQKTIFVKPQTFMNESGRAVKQICDFYKVDVAKDLLVVHDDTDLPLETIRANSNISSAGHKGVQNVIDSLGTRDFHRIRIGVETRASRNDMPTDAFVLQNFTDEELKKLQSDVFPMVKMEIEKFIKLT